MLKSRTESMLVSRTLNSYSICSCFGEPGLACTLPPLPSHLFVFRAPPDVGHAVPLCSVGHAVPLCSVLSGGSSSRRAGTEGEFRRPSALSGPWRMVLGGHQSVQGGELPWWQSVSLGVPRALGQPLPLPCALALLCCELGRLLSRE